MIARLLAWLVDAIIRRAQRTPYTHLPEYMERYWLFRIGQRGSGESGPYPFLGARVHHILRSDTDRHFHDHPWWFVTIILRGGYWEERAFLDERGHIEFRETKWHGPGSILIRRAGDLHRLTLPRGKTAWTLFCTGPKVNDWGFHVDGTMVPWREYLGDEGSFSGPCAGAETPAARWREAGEADPHGDLYNGERTKLTCGHLTDEEIANAVFLDPNIVNLTAAKERIRWLSRALVAASATPADAGLRPMQRAIEPDAILGLKAP